MLRIFITYFFLLTITLIPNLSTQVIASEPDLDEVVTYKFELKLNYGTQKVEIHGKRRFLDFSQMVKQVIETSAVSLFDYFEYTSMDTLHINLNEKATLANGSARVFPDTIINLNLMQALGSELLTADYNYIEGLVIHELTHILQLDQVRGFLSVITDLFGNYGKWGIITPRWFIEGIGVWAETKFTHGGRLKNPMMTAMLYKNILDPDFCQDISCFDRPGEYPHGSYAYWMGGHFIDYIENLNKGNIRCLIEKNSRKIPSTLNSTFEFCTDKKANEHYEDFRKDLVQKAKKFRKTIEGKSFFKNFKKIPKSYDATVLSKNFHILNGMFYRMEHKNDQEAIIATDLNILKNKLYLSENKIEQILAPTLKNKHENSLSLIGYPYLNMEVERQASKILINEGVEEEIPESSGAQYSFMKKDGGSLFLRYNGMKWSLYDGPRKVFTFPKFLSLYHPRIIGKYLYYNSFYQGKNKKEIFSFERLNILKPGLGAENLILLNGPFSFLANDSRHFLFRYKKEFWLMDTQKLKLKRFPSSYASHIAAIRFDGKNNAFLFTYMPENFLSYKGSINQLLNLLKDKGKKTKTSAVLVRNIQRADHIKKKVNHEQIESYPKASLFKPHAWLFLWSFASTDYDFLRFMTTVADPRDHHNVDLMLNYYFELKKPTVSLSYSYLPDDFAIFSAYNNDYLQSRFSLRAVKEENTLAGVGYKFDNTRINLFPKIYYSAQKNEDFLGSRNTSAWNFSLDTQILRINNDDFFQSFQSEIFLAKKDPRNYESYEKLRLNIDSRFRFSYSVGFNLSGSYGKLFKDDYKSGVIFAGGTSEQHSFIGLGSSDAYGNEISTLKGEFNFTLFRPNFGINFIPFYFREFHFLLGQEMLHADRIRYNANTFYNDKVLGSFAGMRSKMNIFYHVPINIDLIMSKIKVPATAEGGYEFRVRLLAGGF